MSDETDTKSTTFTFKPETEQWLLETYPDAIGLNEAIRNAISDARLVREHRNIKLEDDSQNAD